MLVSIPSRERWIVLSLPHSTRKVWPLEITCVLLLAGQFATADTVGEADVLVEVVLTVADDELLPVTLELERVDDDAVDVDEPDVMSLAPQIPLLLIAAPRVDFR
jgi:hypothetical protein